MKNVKVTIEDDLYLQLKAAAKAYGETLQDYASYVLLQAIENIGYGCGNMEVYEKELKRLKKYYGK